ncbi:hypothetical protein SBOR_8463 [Sclerotinia borealis F-4128]|uniref:Uncharacterized protein n=1 Tax=Sclerotinia borealis (strain F-4128) TaxID=1432307 RepID=W9C2Y5_SCLBF|nr:hypothetical protein SBOR_8463 [Sclerotinia borealis F-4128]
MRISTIAALIMAPLVVYAAPAAYADHTSIAQRDAAPQPSVTQRLDTVIEEGQKVTKLVQSYGGGFWDGIKLYNRFQACHKAITNAEKAAQDSNPLGEEESSDVTDALERLSPEFVEISKALYERRKLIVGTHYTPRFLKEIVKLRNNVKTLYTTLENKAYPSDQPRIEALRRQTDDQFIAVKNELLGNPKKTTRSISTDTDASDMEAMFLPVATGSTWDEIKEVLEVFMELASSDSSGFKDKAVAETLVSSLTGQLTSVGDFKKEYGLAE